MRVISGWELHDIGVDETIRIMRERIRPGTPVFVTFDIDFLDAAYAPGPGRRKSAASPPMRPSS